MDNSIYISAINYYLPGTVENNYDLQQEYPEKVKPNLIEMVGVKSRRVVEKGTRASSLALQSGLQLLEETKFDKSKIDALVYCSLHHDYITPSTSCILQDQLGLSTRIATFDITHGCSGYVYGLALAKSIMTGLGMNNVLFLTSSVLTKYIDDANISLRILFGDAASATLLSRADERGKGDVGEFVLATDGAGHERIIIRDGLDAKPLSETSYIPKTDQFGNIYTDSCMYMDGQGVLLFTIKRIPVLIEQTLEKNGLHKDDIDLYILHQANRFSLEVVRKKLDIAPERFFYSMEHTGNTVQATIPICIKDAMDQGKIKPGSKVLIAGFGTGLSWGATVITF